MARVGVEGSCEGGEAKQGGQQGWQWRSTGTWEQCRRLALRGRPAYRQLWSGGHMARGSLGEWAEAEIDPSVPRTLLGPFSAKDRSAKTRGSGLLASVGTGSWAILPPWPPLTLHRSSLSAARPLLSSLEPLLGRPLHSLPAKVTAERDGKSEVLGEWLGGAMGNIGRGGARAGRVPSISWARTRRMAARISLRSSYSLAPRSCE